MEFRDSQTAFEDAIDEGRLSGVPGDLNYAGHFMYMGTSDGVDLFKDKHSRKYLAEKLPGSIGRREARREGRT